MEARQDVVELDTADTEMVEILELDNDELKKFAPLAMCVHFT